jgi:two-component system response regulator (stage 0 sporulation protein A)
MIRVLIADNNVHLCQTIFDFLSTKDDMEVVGIAYNGETALELIREHEPDVVLLDIAMPLLDGMAVLERMNRLSLDNLPSVIVLTALSRDDLIQRFTELGADYFIIKPFDLRLLAERIHQFAMLKNARYRMDKGSGITSQIEEEVIVTKLLQELGVPAHFKGYYYLRDAIIMAHRDKQMLEGGLTKRLYPELAKKYETTANGVEAAIRNAVMATWENGSDEALERIAGNKFQRFPTNSSLIAKLADQLRIAKQNY